MISYDSNFYFVSTRSVSILVTQILLEKRRRSSYMRWSTLYIECVSAKSLAAELYSGIRACQSHGVVGKLSSRGWAVIFLFSSDTVRYPRQMLHVEDWPQIVTHVLRAHIHQAIELVLASAVHGLQQIGGIDDLWSTCVHESQHGDEATGRAIGNWYHAVLQDHA